MPSEYDRTRPRTNETPTPEMELVGRRFRRGRLNAGLSQRQVARKADVSQSLVSRFERGRTPGMSTSRVVAIAAAIGPYFPFGFCPHHHGCNWPYDPDAVKPRISLEM
ncbi:MAG: helix-turn-helix transcriptional regulator [Candidatus Limnocylindrales bacterium]